MTITTSRISPPPRLGSPPASRCLRDGQRLRLLPGGDGWSLLTMDGHVLFRGLGTASRRQCLVLARELGAVVLCS